MIVAPADSACCNALLSCSMRSRARPIDRTGAANTRSVERIDGVPPSKLAMANFSVAAVEAYRSFILSRLLMLPYPRLCELGRESLR